MKASTNEWEFQGEVLSWVNAFVDSHPLGLDHATQEFPNAQGKRSDMILWLDQNQRKALLATEFKTPAARFQDFDEDAVKKARAVGAPYVALWNMRDLSLFRTPQAPRKSLLDSDALWQRPTATGVRVVEDWAKPANKKILRSTAEELVRVCYDLSVGGTVADRVVEPTVFVDWLAQRVRILRAQLFLDFKRGMGRSRTLRNEINEWAKKQGLYDFVDDLDESLAAQMSYRLAGQVIFYYSFKRYEPTLPRIDLNNYTPVSKQLRAYWDAVRAFDYEALYDTSPLESIPLTAKTEDAVGALVKDLSSFDWNSIDLDILGSIFENMIPDAERRILGQYYTPRVLADLVISLTIDSDDDVVLDPGVGTGTFLYRSYGHIRASSGKSHEEVLNQLWGIDISAFPAELAVINLCRLDLSAGSSFPRITVQDFFDVSPSQELTFPPPKRHPGSAAQVQIPLPAADAIVGNPPYIRSQQLDDLEKSYKDRLNLMARVAGVTKTAKFDAFTYYIIHTLDFLKDGGRLGFVIPSSWLNADYGAVFQRFILDHYQPVLILMSEAEIYFPSQDVNTVVLVLEKLSATGKREPRGEIRFGSLLAPISQIVGGESDVDYWSRVNLLASDLECAPSGVYHNFRIAVVDGESERQALMVNAAEPRDWTRFMRTTPVYEELFGA